MNVGFIDSDFGTESCSTEARMSSARQTVVLGLSLTGSGKRPSLTPCHQVDLATGMTAGTGGFASGSPMICFRRTKPYSGKDILVMCVSLIAESIHASGPVRNEPSETKTFLKLSRGREGSGGLGGVSGRIGY